MSAKSQGNNNITTIMPTNDSMSVRMFNVEVDAKLWIVSTSPVIVFKVGRPCSVWTPDGDALDEVVTARYVT